MMKKKIFMPLLGAVVLGMSAYAGYRTYDAYNGVNESDLLLANAEALADDEGGSSDKWPCWSHTEDRGGGVWVCGNPCSFEKELKRDGKSDGWCYKN